jgi:MtN3 and saliva related transmembrane protein
MSLPELRFIGWIAATCTSFGFFPQIIKGLKTKKLDDLSWGLLSLTLTGVLCWLLYGIVIKDLILIISNCVTSTSLIVLVILKIKYKQN